MLKTKIFGVIAALGLAIMPATAQVISSTTLTPVTVSVAYTGQVPAATTEAVTVTCSNLVGIAGSMTQTAQFTAAGGSTTLLFPLQPATVNGGSNCTFTVTGPGVATVSVGGLVRTGPVPVTAATTAAVTVAFPAVTVKNAVVGDAPVDAWQFTLNCSTGGVQNVLNPAVFNGNFALAANGSRTFGSADVPGLTLDSVCETRLLNGFGSVLTYTSTTGTTVINGQVVPNPVLGGVVVNGNFQSALTKANGQIITVTNQYPIKPTTTVAPTTVPATTTTAVTTTTTTLPPATLPATTAPPVVAGPAIEVIVEPSFTG